MYNPSVFLMGDVFKMMTRPSPQGSTFQSATIPPQLENPTSERLPSHDGWNHLPRTRLEVVHWFNGSKNAS